VEVAYFQSFVVADVMKCKQHVMYNLSSRFVDGHGCAMEKLLPVGVQLCDIEGVAGNRRECVVGIEDYKSLLSVVVGLRYLSDMEEVLLTFPYAQHFL
jgi:hypothetical protein